MGGGIARKHFYVQNKRLKIRPTCSLTALGIGVWVPPLSKLAEKRHHLSWLCADGKQGHHHSQLIKACSTAGQKQKLKEAKKPQKHTALWQTLCVC